jgi:hypothetical protein
MRTMNMPGFTAEASLFPMDKSYQQTIALRPTNLDSVQPAAPHGWGIDQSCYDNCIDGCFDGHVHPSVCIKLCRNECRTPLQ